MPTITFKPSGKTAVVMENANLMIAALRAGLPVGSSCSGQGICNKCVMKIETGGANLSAPGPLEQALKERENFADAQRVSCQSKVLGDVTVSTTYW